MVPEHQVDSGTHDTPRLASCIIPGTHFVQSRTWRNQGRHTYHLLPLLYFVVTIVRETSMRCIAQICRGCHEVSSPSTVRSSNSSNPWPAVTALPTVLFLKTSSIIIMNCRLVATEIQSTDHRSPLFTTHLTTVTGLTFVEDWKTPATWQNAGLFLGMLTLQAHLRMWQWGFLVRYISAQRTP